MTCAEIENELVAYHFGVLDDEVRLVVERHLVECPECVGAFVALKRAVEAGEDAPPASDTARGRLRRAVAHELGIGTTRWSWWERPLAVAVAAGVVLVAGATTHAIATSSGSPPHALARQE